MSIMKSIRSGMSGLTANSRALGVVGDNIANANTAGFKAGRANFADMLAGTTLGGGSGVQLGSVQQHFGQGDMEMTGNALDLGISGPGFFMVKGEVGGDEGTFYTRAGQFTLDAEGYVSSPGGLRLQGYAAGADGQIEGASPGDLNLGSLERPPRPTGSIAIEMNLSADAEVPAGAWDPADPEATSNYSSGVTLYDALGSPIDATVYYRKTGPGAWEYHVMADGEDLQGGTAGLATEIGSGALAFGPEGELQTHTPGPTNFTPRDAAAPQPFAIELEGTTQLAGDSTTRKLSQDGGAAGELRDVTIDEKGQIVGIFSNGENEVVGQVAMSDFAAPEGLERLGGNLWAATPASGEALVGPPGSGRLGAVVSGAVEGSNVDMSHEFVKMIAYQRGFQASSKAITTGDQLLNDVINLKR